MAREMKDSGIRWVGEIPSYWNVNRNKVCFDCSKEIVGEKSADTQLLSLTTKGIKEKRAEDSAGKVPESYDTYQIVKPDDIIMCLFDLDVSAVFSGISSFSGMISPAYKVLKCRENYIMPGYADYWFSFVFNGRKFKHYAKNLRYTLNYDEFAVLPVILPPIHEQERIAYFLGAECVQIDAVIAQTRTSIEEYKKMKQAIITQAVTKGICSNQSMKDSGIDWIGVISEDYTCRKLKSFVDVISKGTTPKEISNEFSDNSTIRYIKSENIVNNQLSEYPLFSINESIHTGELKRSQLTSTDILFVIAGASIGKVAIMREELLPANTNQATSFIRISKEYSFYKKYIWYFLQSNFIKTYISLFAVQSAQPNLSLEDLGEIYITIPKEENVVCEIARYLDTKCSDIDNLINKKLALLTELEILKKSLIYEYVTGKKEVCV